MLLPLGTHRHIEPADFFNLQFQISNLRSRSAAHPPAQVAQASFFSPPRKKIRGAGRIRTFDHRLMGRWSRQFVCSCHWAQADELPNEIVKIS
jgi:hypothetical protein